MIRFLCESIYKSFGGVIALADVCLEIPCGEVTAIIGPNGAGKTTLFNVLTGFSRPDSGRWFLGMHELTGLEPNRVARIGMVRTFQNIRLIRNLSVLDNLMLARPDQSGENFFGLLNRHRIAKEERRDLDASMDILGLLNLEPKANDLSGNLSYGEQKLLSLGCALATGASFLLLDEPLAGVHPALGERILDTLRVLVSNQRGIVFIEHDIDAVRKSADRVIVMSAGRVVADGRPHDVLEKTDIVEVYLA